MISEEQMKRWTLSQELAVYKGLRYILMYIYCDHFTVTLQSLICLVTQFVACKLDKRIFY